MLKMDNSVANSYYEFSRNQTVDGSKLSENENAQVVVIGGGLTGCSTALHLAEKGIGVAVLESRNFGWGASGRSGGQIINGFSCEMSYLEATQGKEIAQELWQHSLNSVDYTRKLVEKHNIDCDLEMGYLHLGIKSRQADELKHWAESLAKDYGYEAMEYLDKSELRTVINTEKYQGGMFDPQSGHLHPLNYCLGVVQAAKSAGAKLYSNTQVHRIENISTNKKRVHTETGYIDCDEVVYACNAYLENLAPEIDKKIMPVGTYILATEPMGEEAALGLISNRAAVSDTNFVLDYYRLSADNRMLFGGRVSYSKLEPRKLANSLRKRMLDVFPQTEGMKIDFSWGGYVAITQNRAPHVGKTKDGCWFAHGYSGHGMALTGYIGKLLAEAISGNTESISCFKNISHRSFPGGRLLRTPALVAAMAYYKLKDRF